MAAGPQDRRGAQAEEKEVNYIAQIASEAAPFAQYGLLGAVLGWFMLRGEKIAGELRSLAHRIDGLTKALLVDMTERESSGIHTKRYAKDEIAKIDARAQKK